MSKAHLLSLGCPKNLVDSDNLLRKLAERGIHYTAGAGGADIILVNTCGFIEDATRESVEEILRAAELKKEKKGSKLVVFGCLAKRAGAELLKEIPEIDALWGVGQEEEIIEYCTKHMQPSEGEGEAFIQTPYAYLKVAEGCDRACSYCVIPGIRGAFQSRRPEEILAEAGELVRSGRKELILVAQDITSYGTDLGGYPLARLLRELAAIEGDFWIRLLYLYPEAIDDTLLETIATEEKICNYIDMPLQHSERKILKLMRRGGSHGHFLKLVRRIRDAVPGVALRTTVITGFPQETEEDFGGLLEFVQEAAFDRLGAFTYSKEKGSSAAGLKGQVPKKTRETRRHRIMEAQAAISLKRNEALVGRTFRALVDEAEDVAIARIYSQAPEIDGVIIIEDRTVRKGSFVQVKITEAYDYDLKGVIVPDDEMPVLRKP